MQRFMVITVKRVFPQIGEKYPYMGRYSLINAKIGKQYFQIAVSGIYRITFKTTDGISKNFLSGSMIMEIKNDEFWT